MTYDDSFVIYINYAGDFEEVSSVIRDAIPEAEWRSTGFGIMPENYIQTGKHVGYDLARVNESVIYWKHEVLVISRRQEPISKADMIDQAELAQRMLQAIESKGFEFQIRGFDIDEFL